MKNIGLILIIIGVCGLLYSFSMDTSVKVEYPSETKILKNLSGRVNNLGLMQEKQNYIIISGIVLIAGILLFIFGKGSEEIMKEKFKEKGYIDFGE